MPNVSATKLNIAIVLLVPILGYLFLTKAATSPLVSPRSATKPSPSPSIALQEEYNSCTHWMFDIPNGSTWRYTVTAPNTDTKKAVPTIRTLRVVKEGSTANEINFTYSDTVKSGRMQLRCGKYGLVGTVDFSLAQTEVTVFPYETSPTTFTQVSSAALNGSSFGLPIGKLDIPINQKYATSIDQTGQLVVKNEIESEGAGQTGAARTTTIIKTGVGIESWALSVGAMGGVGGIEVKVKLISFTPAPLSSSR